jgi:hypothetical protein
VTTNDWQKGIFSETEPITTEYLLLFIERKSKDMLKLLKRLANR